MKSLNSTAGALLGFLHEGPMSGWDLAQTAQDRIGEFWTITRSQVYRELATMAEAGLISAGAAGARERRPYRITAAGRAAFRRWLAEAPGPEQIRYPLLLKMSFAQHMSRDALAGFVAAHRAEHEARLKQYVAAREAGATGDDPLAFATLDFGIRYERAVLEWFDALPPEIADA